MAKQTPEEVERIRRKARKLLDSKEGKAELHKTLVRIANAPPRTREPFDPNKLYGKIEEP